MSDVDAMSIRRASPPDVDVICAIYNEAISERRSTFETKPCTASDFQKRISVDQLPFLVGEIEQVLGWAGLSEYSGRPCYAGIGEASIYVAPEARGMGVGTALTEALAAESERRGYYKLLGKLFTDNHSSIRLVERCGFSEVGTHRCHGQLDGKWRDVLLVERLLGVVEDVARPSTASPG